jgi:hypothetical protein
MIAMVMTVFDGALSIIFQPIMAAICSGVGVSVALLLGLFFRIPVLGRLWRATPIPASVLIIASVTVLCFGSQLGLAGTFTDPESKQQVRGLRSEAALGGYFTLLFAITNWPSRARRRVELDAPPNAGPATPSGSSGLTEGPPSVS